MKASVKIFCIVLISLLFVHSNYLLLYYALYKINTQDLTENCCKKQVVNCNASCYLSFKMTESSENGSSSRESQELKLKISEFVSLLPDSFILPLRISCYNSYNITKITDNRTTDIDHPPQL